MLMIHAAKGSFSTPSPGHKGVQYSWVQAAEPALAPGALVVADNAGVFAEGGLWEYLRYVRGSPRYQSRFVASSLEWRDDVPDGLEVSVFTGGDKQ